MILTRIQIKYLALVLLLATAFILPMHSHAADDKLGNFSLQVTPSPIIETIAPGVTKDIELKIRNNGDKIEDLQIATKGFTIKASDGTIVLIDVPAGGISGWVTFANPTFTIRPGEWFTEHVTIAVPKDAGFSYSFALQISRTNNGATTPGAANLNGSVVVFALINIDRPDAKRQISIASFSASRNVYEYLPTTFTLKFKNSGNTIVQPYGNIYIQRTKNSSKPIDVLPVNEARGYILSGSERTLTTEWKNGFPVYTVQKSDTGQDVQKLTWNWDNIGQFRIGKYYARVVAVYNDGQHDVPIEGIVSFWVIPWKLLLGLALIITLLLVGIITIIKKFAGLRPKKKPQLKTDTDTDEIV